MEDRQTDTLLRLGQPRFRNFSDAADSALSLAGSANGDQPAAGGNPGSSPDGELLDRDSLQLLGARACVRIPLEMSDGARRSQEMCPDGADQIVNRQEERSHLRRTQP